MRKNKTIAALIKISFLLVFFTASKLSMGQGCTPLWDQTKSSPCENSPISFLAQATGKNTYEWDFGDGIKQGPGTSTADRDPVHAYTKAGTYTVTYKFTFNGGSPCTGSFDIKIKESPIVKVRALYNRQQCFLGNKFCFIDSTLSGQKNPASKILTVKYLFSDGALYTITDPKGGDTICHSVIDPNGGYFDLTIEAEDYNGCVTKIKYDKYIRVFPKIGVAFKSIGPVACDSVRVTITNLTDTFTKLKDIAKFTWDFGFPGSPDNIIEGDSVTKTEWWRGPTGNGVMKHLYDVSRKPSGTYIFNGKLTVTTKYGCTETFTFKSSATVSVLHVKIIADPDSSCSSQPLTEFTAVDVETLQPISATTFLWNFGDPPSGPANFDKNTLIKAPHNYGLGPWMTSVNIRSGPCNVTVLDTITKVGPTSTIEVPFNRVPEDQKYQCVIRDTVRFPNNSSFYHVDDVPVYEDSSAVYRYYTLSSGRKVPYWEKPLKTASIPAYGKYQGRASLITIFYLDKDTLESFTQAANDADSIIYYVNGKKVKKPVSNPIISGVDTLNIQKIKQYAFTWPGNQTKINSTKIPPGPQKHKDHALRLWTFGDNYAPKCTTDTRKNKNVKLNCNFSMDSLPIHWYTPWDQIYKYYNNGQFYGAAAEKTVLCKGGRFCYKIKYYPAMSFVIPSDTLVIVPKDATVSYGGQTITPATPEKMTGSFRIKKVPTKIVGLGTYIPTLSDEKWTFKTPNSISIKNIIAGTYATRTSGTYTMVNMRDQFELKAEHAWKTYTLSSTRPVGYDELVLNHTEPLHKEILIHKNYGSIPSKGTYQLDMNQTTRFFLAKDTIETFYQKYDDADSIIFFVNGVKVKKPLTNPINSGSDVLTITKFRVVADTAFSQFQVVITAGRTINAQPTTICVDTMIGGRDTFIQRSKIFIDSNFHRQNFYTKTAQCNTVQLYHEDTVHALRCKSTSQISLALLPPNAKGLEFKGIKCYAPPSPPYGMEFTVSKTKPGCTQRLLKFNFDSAGGKNNWTTHGGFLSPPLPGSTPWHLGYQLSGAYPTAFVQPYTAGQIQNKNPGWVTVGVIIGNGRWLDKTAPLDTIECIDTVWYHNAFRYLYLDSRFDVIAPERDQKRVCVGDTITFKLIDPIMDSVTQLVWNWNDDEGSYYEERTSYYKPYPGPSSTRNDKIIKDWKKGDKWLYSYVVRLEYDGFSYKTLDTIVTGIIRRWSIGVNFERAGDALKNAFTALGLTMSEIPSAEIPLYFGNGTGTGCIDTTGLGSLIQYGVTPYRDALTNHTVKVMIKSKVAPYKDSIAVKSKVAPYKDSIATVGFKIGDTWYRYTDFTKKDSVIISQKLHWRDSSQAGWDTLKQVNPNKYSNLKVTPGVYRHVYKKASRYFPTFQLRNTEGCFQPRNKEVDVGFFWQWTFSDSIICHGNTQVVARDSIRYFAYEDPFNWLNGRAYWRESARFLAQREFKKLDFNEHDDSIKANKFAVTGLGVPPFKWTYDDPGIYTIRIAMKDSLGCVDTARQKVYVTGVKAGFRNLSDTLKCKNIVSFFDTSRLIDPCVAAKGKPCDNIIEYTWDFGDGKQKSKLQHPSHDFTQNGYFTVRLKVRTKLGCEDSASMVVFIAGPRPYFNPENDTIICVGDSVIFNNLSHDPVYQPDWIWDFGDGQQLSSKTKASVGHRYTKPGTFQVYLTQFDDVNGTKIRCSAIYPDTSSEVVQKVLRIVKVKPVAPADFDPKDTSICPNTTITFRENSDPIYTRFSWRLGTGDTLERKKGELTRYTYTKPGIYKVIMIPDYDTPEFHKCLDTQSRIVTVMDVKAAFTIDETKTPIFCSVNTSTDAVKYEWSINNGGTFIGSSSTDENPCYQWPDTGCFRVTLKAINSIGCWDTTSQVVCSSFVAIIIPYNVFTPEPKDNFNDVFRVKAQGLDKFDIKIYNRWGELVFESEDYNFAWDGTVKNKGKIECPEGTYLYIMNYQIKNKPLNDGRDKPMSGVVTLIRGKKD